MFLEALKGQIKVHKNKRAFVRNALEVFFKWAAEFGSDFTYYKPVQVT